ncbi:hypothetical protein JOD54_004966 [Actinokineospora baliensis]|nr:hypothetical protein [Actinokineospora baliensis]
MIITASAFSAAAHWPFTATDAFRDDLTRSGHFQYMIDE